MHKKTIELRRSGWTNSDQAAPAELNYNYDTIFHGFIPGAEKTFDMNGQAWLLTDYYRIIWLTKM